MLKKFISTSRYNKPHGILFLYYPCIWGMVITNANISDVLFFCIVFLFGACGMRSAGCIWNDYNDRSFDKKVKRTKNRDIASGKIKKNEIILFAIINIFIGIIPLYFIPIKSIFLCLCVVPLILTYPLMKRITWWPQLWLGINYNWGVLIGFSVFKDSIIEFEMIFFYIGCVFWTIAYDTVYGYQDIKDDMKIGIKSTSIKFRKSPKLFLTVCYLFSCFCWSFAFQIIDINHLVTYSIIILFFILFIGLIITNLKKPEACYRFFVYNSYFGFLVTLILII